MVINPQVEIQLIAILVALSCSLSGIFLVLRQIAMLSDAISHTILLGIVIGFFITHDLSSPLLIIGATLVGVLTVFLVERLNQIKLIKKDAAIGLVFPLLFSIGVILITRYAGNVHLDIDAVLLGEIAFAPFNRLSFFGLDLGPKSVYIMGIILILNILYLITCYKELKIVTFDPQLAAVLGISPTIIHYSLLTLVSITAVGAFDAVGTILVVALMIGPATTAYLLTDNLKIMIISTASLAVFSSISGYWLANLLDVSIAGSMATMVGVTFLLVFLFAPQQGLISSIKRRKKQKLKLAKKSLLIYLFEHKKNSNVLIEELLQQFTWSRSFLNKTIQSLVKENLILKTKDSLQLSKKGRRYISENYDKLTLKPLYKKSK